VCDGWATQQFVVRAASVRGYDHRYRGIARQDDYVIRPVAGEAIVFAVADGVSSATLSHRGATAACHTATRWLVEALDRRIHPLPWRDILGEVARELTAQAAAWLRVEAPDPEQVEKLFATTLVLGLIGPTTSGCRVSLIQVGDSSAWVLQHGRYHSVLSTKADVSAAVEPLPRVPRELRSLEFELPADAVLLVGTDGFGDPLGDGSGLVGAMFAEALVRPPSPIGLARLLDFSRETFDDDRALVAIWPRPGTVDRR
jgi:serine/threonine protein phosphatase PrpC